MLAPYQYLETTELLLVQSRSVAAGLPRPSGDCELARKALQRIGELLNSGGSSLVRFRTFIHGKSAVHASLRHRMLGGAADDPARGGGFLICRMPDGTNSSPFES